MNYRAVILSFCALFILMVGMRSASARPPVPENSMKAAYLYNFLLFTTWPTNKSGNLNVCVYEVNTLGQPLLDIEDRIVKESKIKVTLISTINSKFDCHVMFLPDVLSAHTVLDVSKALENHSVLTISDHPNAHKAGVMISLFLENNKLAFDINYAAVKHEGIELSSKLLRLAKTVHAEAAP